MFWSKPKCAKPGGGCNFDVTWDVKSQFHYRYAAVVLEPLLNLNEDCLAKER